jgi:hypothetical protein
MRQVEEYEARAELAEAQAKRARDARERETCLEIARLWRRLAEHRLTDLRPK